MSPLKFNSSNSAFKDRQPPSKLPHALSLIHFLDGRQFSEFEAGDNNGLTSLSIGQTEDNVARSISVQLRKQLIDVITKRGSYTSLIRLQQNANSM